MVYCIYFIAWLLGCMVLVAYLKLTFVPDILVLLNNTAGLFETDIFLLAITQVGESYIQLYIYTQNLSDKFSFLNCFLEFNFKGFP